MSNKVVKKEETSGAVAIPEAFRKKSGTTNVIDPKDMLIPRLLIMQGLSKYVAEERAQSGEIVNSVTAEVLGGKGKWLKFVPLTTYKTVRMYEIVDGKKKLSSEENWNATKHANLQWDQVIDGKPFRAVECLYFYLFLEKDLENPSGLPYLARYESTQKSQAKKLITHFMQMDMMGVEPYFGTLEITTQKTQNKEGQPFYIPDFKPSGTTDAKHAKKLSDWVDLITKNQVQIDDSEDDTDSATAAPTPRDVRPDAQPGAQF